MPRRCVIYIPLLPSSYWCIMSLMVSDGISEYVKHIGVGLMRCSFRLAGPFLGASERGASDSAGLHAFFVL